jgi:hypothetical protein
MSLDISLVRRFERRRGENFVRYLLDPTGARIQKRQLSQGLKLPRLAESSITINYQTPSTVADERRDVSRRTVDVTLLYYDSSAGQVPDWCSIHSRAPAPPDPEVNLG